MREELDFLKDKNDEMAAEIAELSAENKKMAGEIAELSAENEKINERLDHLTVFSSTLCFQMLVTFWRRSF